ncbi:hypothetical protein ACPA54_00805 [Uniformispora flossi]
MRVAESLGVRVRGVRAVEGVVSTGATAIVETTKWVYAPDFA